MAVTALSAVGSLLWAVPAAAADGAPPPVIPVDRAYAEPEPVPEADAAESAPPEPPEHPSAKGSAGIGAHFLFAAGKALPGATLRIGSHFLFGEVEGSFIWITDDDPNSDHHFLGNQLGAFLMGSPLRLDRVRLAAGLGGDFYSLWNIHGDIWKMAFAARLRADGRIASNVWGFVTARGYIVSSEGLELGVAHDGSDGLPFLFGTGVEWSFE